MSDLTRKLWPAFLAESSEQLEALELALLQDCVEVDINAVFRHFHTLKGGCAMMGFAGMEAIAHACEDLLDGVRRGERVLDAALTAALLAALDCLKAQLAGADQDGAGPAPEPALLARLHDLAGNPAATADAAAAPADTVNHCPQLVPLLRDMLAPLCAAALQETAWPAPALALLEQLQQTARADDAAAVATLAQQLAATAPGGARLPLLAELMDRVSFLEATVAPGLAAEASRLLRGQLEAELRQRTATAVSALATPGARRKGELAAALHASTGLLQLTQLLGLAHSRVLLRLALQVLRECQRGTLAATPEMQELLQIAVALPNELLPGLEEDAPYVAMAGQLQDKLQEAIVHAARRDSLAARDEAIRERIEISPAVLAALDADALDRLETALAGADCIVELRADLEAAADAGAAFMAWLTGNGSLIGSCTLPAPDGAASARLCFVAALALAPEAIRTALGRLDVAVELQVCARRAAAGDSAPTTARAAARSNGTLRVDSTVVDGFVNRVGEMVTLRNMMAHALYRDELAARQDRLALLLRDRSAAQPLADAELEEVRALLAALAAQREELQQSDVRLQGALARLQEGVLELRVVPVGQVFNRLPRVVHDLSQALGRDVRCELAGEDVRIDKGMVDVLLEPLLHLVRNAIDHGIEPAAERRAAGKPAQALLRVSARQAGSMLLLEVADDGRGLNHERIRTRAVSAGLVSAADAAGLGERELSHLIFLPGFSTAEQVSEISGRGVGMDVVKTRVNQIGGQIEVESTAGRGASFTLRLPLSAAIQNVILVAAGTRQLALPERNVAEILSLPASALQTVQGQACCLLRGVTLPLYRLSALLGAAATAGAGERLEVVVMTDGVQRIGVVVERVLGRPEVFLRDMHPDLARLPGVGGASILGDGRVVIVADCEKLFDLALRQAQSLPSLVHAS
jgi:two-component system chemotaxis sensor kinase CheA